MSILAPVEVDIYNGVLADLALMPEVGKLTPGEFAVVLESTFPPLDLDWQARLSYGLEEWQTSRNMD